MDDPRVERIRKEMESDNCDQWGHPCLCDEVRYLLEEVDRMHDMNRRLADDRYELNKKFSRITDIIRE